MTSYIPIASQTLTSAASSVTFSSIPTTLDGKTLRDLVLVCEFTTDSATNAELRLRVNGDTSSIYSSVSMAGDGSTAQSTSTTTNVFRLGRFVVFNNTYRGFSTCSFLDYAQTDKHKSWLVRTDAAANGTEALAGRYGSTSAITSMNIFPTAGNLAIGSTFSLYGIEG